MADGPVSYLPLPVISARNNGFSLAFSGAVSATNIDNYVRESTKARNVNSWPGAVGYTFVILTSFYDFIRA